jgi:hypothetical protein
VAFGGGKIKVGKYILEAAGFSKTMGKTSKLRRF